MFISPSIRISAYLSIHLPAFLYFRWVDGRLRCCGRPSERRCASSSTSSRHAPTATAPCALQYAAAAVLQRAMQRSRPNATPTLQQMSVRTRNERRRTTPPAARTRKVRGAHAARSPPTDDGAEQVAEQLASEPLVAACNVVHLLADLPEGAPPSGVAPRAAVRADANGHAPLHSIARACPHKHTHAHTHTPTHSTTHTHKHTRALAHAHTRTHARTG
jgi:hypothetical protein